MNRRFSALFAVESQDQPATASLSPETRAVLIEEMQAISEAMGRIHMAIVLGQRAGRCRKTPVPRCRRQFRGIALGGIGIEDHPAEGIRGIKKRPPLST